MPRLLPNKEPTKISEVRVEKKSERKSEYEKERVIKIEQSMSPSEYAQSRICGFENFIRKDFIIHDFEFRTRAEKEASIRTYMKKWESDKYIRLLRSTYK